MSDRGGSNIVFGDHGYDGLVVLNKITGFSIEQSEDGFLVHIAAGEPWDAVVARTVEAGLTGIESLSLIPGAAGSAPVQNIGAYGQQISDSLVNVEAYDPSQHRFCEINHDACRFAYRRSRFNSEDKGKFAIVGMTLRLQKATPQPPFYKDVDQYLADNHITSVTPKVIRDAVIAIRTRKLPDPAKVANNGSFFRNPLIAESAYQELLTKFPELKANKTDDGQLKLYAGQLIDMAGLKGFHDPETGMATWDSQALVLVNEHATSAADLLHFKQKIIDKVQAMFGITLEQEPEYIDAHTA
jgi:UDP-N-acetylmuramate dehydrogenase